MMDPVWFDAATTTNTLIALRWNALTGTLTGGSGVAITNYVIEWDQGTGTISQSFPVVGALTAQDIDGAFTG